MPIAIQTEHLTFRYPGTPRAVVRDVSVRAHCGEITGIVGPNAAGKTTLLRLMLGTLELQHGVIRIFEEDLHRMSAEARARRLAYVAQRPSVDASFTVREVIALGRYAVGRSRAAVDDALERCGLTDLAAADFHTLSVGQQQRVSLARAIGQLHGRPDHEQVLLLDEPVSAMDPRHLAETARILQGVADRGTAVVIVLHDLPLVARLCDAVIALQSGCVAAVGPTRKTLTIALLESLYETRFDLVAPVSSATSGRLAAGGSASAETGQSNEALIPLPSMDLVDQPGGTRATAARSSPVADSPPAASAPD